MFVCKSDAELKSKGSTDVTIFFNSFKQSRYDQDFKEKERLNNSFNFISVTLKPFSVLLKLVYVSKFAVLAVSEEQEEEAIEDHFKKLYRLFSHNYPFLS